MKETFIRAENRIMQSLAVVMVLSIMVASISISYRNRQAELDAIEVSDRGTAGIATVMSGVQTAAITTAVSVDESRVESVATQLTEGEMSEDASAEAIAEGTAEGTEEEATETATAEESDPEWQDMLVTTADDYMNVRSEASSDSALAGKLRRGDVAEITEVEDGWYEISSGNLTGYVSSDYVVTGDDAKALANETCLTYVKSLTSGLHVRSAASEDASVLTALGEGERLEYDADAEAVDGWTAVDYGGTTGYVKSEYATVYLATGTGITVEEERQALEKAEAEKAAKASAQKASTTVATVQNQPVAASYDDVTLLAALIQCEAGWESYEGQLAVGAVVVNRLHSGYGGSLYDVIYARGQFSPAGSGQVAAAAAAGPRGSCVQAAQEALSGVDNTGGARSFRPVRSGYPGTVIGNHVFW